MKKSLKDETKQRIIFHMDADSFFANCEISRNPKYKNKPVVVGGVDRGIAVAVSQVGKERGIHRGMISRDIRSVCPDAIVLPVDFRLYGLYSDFMFSIFEEYIPNIQKYSIDECFGFIDVDNFLQAKELAYKIKDDIQKKLDITVSIGVSTTKVLAKIASKQNKPNGVCVLDPISSFTQNIFKDMTVGKVWGIGGQTAVVLNKKYVYTVRDFLKLSPRYIQTNFNKNLREIWNELSGVPVKSFYERDGQKSIQKTRTFKPQTSNKSIILSHLSQNIENAFWKARRMNVAPREVHFFIKTSEFRYKRKSISFGKGIINQSIVLAEARKICDELVDPKVLYRATGVTLSNLYPTHIQYDLFGEHNSNSRLLSMYKVIDDLSLKYGKKMMGYGSSFMKDHQEYRSKKKQAFKEIYSDVDFLRLGLPFLGRVS